MSSSRRLPTNVLEPTGTGIIRVVDAQLHEPPIFLPWPNLDERTRAALLTESVLTAMASVGVDAAVLFPVDEEAWAAQLSRDHPDRFCWVAMLQPSHAPERVALARPASPSVAQGATAVRVIIGHVPEHRHRIPEQLEAFADSFEFCERERVPVFLYCALDLTVAGTIAARYPGLALIVDHYGIFQPPSYTAEGSLEALPDLLQLARFPNVYVKACGMPSVSRQAYPFSDVWPAVRAVVDGFGAQRIMWASDMSRFLGLRGFAPSRQLGRDYPGRHSYSEALHLFRDTDLVTDVERRWILGDTARAVLRRKL